MTQICDDLLVVELGNGSAAGSETGMFLADNGARVIKVEPPAGDRLRTAVPSAWLVWNRGKESLVADLTAAPGRQTVRDLLTAADVVIECCPAGQAEAWGVGYDHLRAVNPGLVYCSIKGFGPSGPYARIAGDDALVMAKAGAFARGDFGFRSGPIFSGGRIASNGAAHQAASGILAALIVRDRTGMGQRVDASLFLGLSPIDYFVSYHVQMGRRATAPSGAAAAAERRTPVATRYMLSACTRDGRWIFFSPQLPHQAKALIHVLELDWMLEDARFSDMPAFWTLDDAAAWEGAIYERVKERDLEEWTRRALANNDLAFEPVLSPEEALDHPQLRANGNVITVADPVHGPIEEIGPIACFDRTAAVIQRSAPALDAHDPLPALGPGPGAAASSPASLPRHALQGITIVEFGYFYAMPYGVTMAGALGARVIKVENLDGDPMRWSFGPPEWGSLKTMEGKESICLDVRTDRGRRIIHQLIRTADVFVQGFRPGVDQRLGVDYATARALNPQIVYVHGAGYGSSGPYAHRPIYAGTAASAAGSVHRQGAYWLDPDLNKSLDATSAQAVVAPRMRNLTDGDANAAVGVLSAILFGLRHKVRTGEGQFVGTSMLGGNVFAYSDDFNRYPGKPPVRQTDAEQLGLSATYRLYQAQAGWVFLAAESQEDWTRAMAAAGQAELLTEERFASSAARTAHDADLSTVLEALFRTRPASEWEATMLEAGAHCVAVTEATLPETAVTDPNIRAMGLVAEIDHPAFGSLLRYAPPAALSLTPGRVAPACTVAQHTAAILGQLGYSEDEIAKLAADSVVRVAET
jgi:crotonobetainyl-CoA:carnitine CoA-transferase CaiB-like acyl-CoA transferase